MVISLNQDKHHESVLHTEGRTVLLLRTLEVCIPQERLDKFMKGKSVENHCNCRKPSHLRGKKLLGRKN